MGFKGIVGFKQMKYNITIKFITDYLQARYSEEAKEELVNQTSRGIQDVNESLIDQFLYRDEKGIYIPAVQLQKCLEASSRATKWKKTKSNWLKWAIAYITVVPSRIYLEKEKPDNILLSYPKRKDGSRVKTIHPLFNAGFQINFSVIISDPENQYTDKDVQNLVAKGGQMFGIGGRRSDKFGRFEIVKFEKE